MNETIFDGTMTYAHRLHKHIQDLEVELHVVKTGVNKVISMLRGKDDETRMALQEILEGSSRARQ
jgi:hypothetical protein